MEVLTWLVAHRKTLFKAILGLVAAFLLSYGVILYKQNKTLSESLEMAQNNIEAYQGVLNDSQQANNVLKLTVDELQNNNDKLINELDSMSNELKIKTSQIRTAATQTQTITVKESKGVRGDLIEILKDTIYKDSIKYNDLTSVRYTIGKDTVSIELDVNNTQYLYIYKKREYKNKKSFIKRLFTLDFKKVDKYKYDIVNTNDIISTDNVRVVEINK